MKGVCDNQYIHVQMIEKRSQKSACISGWKYVMLIHILTFYGNKYDFKKKKQLKYRYRISLKVWVKLLVIYFV